LIDASGLDLSDHARAEIIRTMQKHCGAARQARRTDASDQEEQRAVEMARSGETADKLPVPATKGSRDNLEEKFPQLREQRELGGRAFGEDPWEAARDRHRGQAHDAADARARLERRFPGLAETRVTGRTGLA
jgi:hypothetical protein